MEATSDFSHEERPPTTSRRKVVKVVCVVFCTIVLIGMLLGWYLTTAPVTFTKDMHFEVATGMSARDIANAAKEQKLVRSSLMLFAVLVSQYEPTSIYAGTYVFTEPLYVFGVAEKLASKKTTEALISITFPEGITITKMAEIAANTSGTISTESYLDAANQEEGYLFPETYFIPFNYTAADLVTLQKESLFEALAPHQSLIDDSLWSLDEILTLASIVEREANDETSMKMVAGILQNRLEIGMALQADATIEYVLATPLNELPPGQLANELREVDSPYNTYKQPGLPPTPIGNPGLQSILAVLEPTPSEYLFYITGTDGTFYYAETLSEHNQNIARYLR